MRKKKIMQQKDDTVNISKLLGYKFNVDDTKDPKSYLMRGSSKVNA